ncbi:unnamed protein product [Cuscuta campestris]|uniref:Uncharacterized protein n=1 Tax=Cuscuta campestris TaxID=132261 RepID=A0A484MC93_9ASTE|nr:unnamed protein product [Cuscuta campestris]
MNSLQCRTGKRMATHSICGSRSMSFDFGHFVCRYGGHGTLQSQHHQQGYDVKNIASLEVCLIRRLKVKSKSSRRCTLSVLILLVLELKKILIISIKRRKLVQDQYLVVTAHHVGI